jgi:hypothetical protein
MNEGVDARRNHAHVPGVKVVLPFNGVLRILSSPAVTVNLRQVQHHTMVYVVFLHPLQLLFEKETGVCNWSCPMMIVNMKQVC